MMLGGLGLGLAMLGRKRRWRRYAMSQMMGGGYTGGPWGRFGGYGHGGPGGPAQAFTLPPFIEATLKAWHDRQHGTVPCARSCHAFRVASMNGGSVKVCCGPPGPPCP